MRSTSSSHGQRLPWLAAAVAIIAVALAALYSFPLNHDVGFFYHAAGRMLEGTQLYRDIYEPNPPLIYYLCVPPAWLAHRMQLNPIAVLYGYFAVLLVSSLMLCRAVIRDLELFATETVRRLTGLGLLTAFLIMPFMLQHGSEFGQREHLTVVLIMPYLLAAAGEAGGKRQKGWLPWLVGAVAGLGLAFKPQFVAIWFGVEGSLALALRSWRPLWRPTSLAVGLVLILFALFILVVEPGFFSMLALAASTGGGGSIEPLWHYRSAVWVAAALGLLLVRPVDGCRRTLFVAATLFLVVIAIQGMGFPYHYYPAMACSALVVLLSLARLVDPAPGSGRHPRRWLAVAVTLAMIVLPAATVFYFQHKSHQHRRSTYWLIGLLQNKPPGQRLFQLSTAVDPLFPAVNHAHARWSGHFNCLWPLPVFYPSDEDPPGYRSPDKMSQTERLVFDTVIDDLIRRPPDLLLVDVKRCKINFLSCRKFDYLEYFGQDRRFGRLMQGYHRLSRDDRFELWQRR